MRFTTLSIALLFVSLWGQTGHADIYVWVDENNIKHFTNENPPPQAEVLMKTKEIPYDEAADRARQEAARQQELMQTQAQIRAYERQIAQQQADAARRIAAADRRAEETLQRAEDLLESAEKQYVSDRDDSPSYTYYPWSYLDRPYYRSSPFYYRSDGGIYYYKSRKFHNGQHLTARQQFSIRQQFRNRFKTPEFRLPGVKRNFKSDKPHFRQHNSVNGGISRFGQHDGGRNRFSGHQRGSFRKR